MTHTELLTAQIKHYLNSNRFMTVESFRDMYVNELPGKLTFLAISRDGKNVLPIFDSSFTYDYTKTDLVDYNEVRNVLGGEWMPLISAHVWNPVVGEVPRTLLSVDGIVSENTLHTIFGTLPRWHGTVGTVLGLNFGRFDTKTLPTVSMYTVDLEGARRIRTLNGADEGKVRNIHLDIYGNINYVDITTGKTVIGCLEVGRGELDWHVFEL